MRLSLPLPPQVFSAMREGTTRTSQTYEKTLTDQTGDGIYFASKINSLQKHTCSLERVVLLLAEEKVMQMCRLPCNTNLTTLLLEPISAQGPLVQFGTRARADCLVIFPKRPLPCLPYLPLGHYITPMGNCTATHTPWGTVLPHAFSVFFHSVCFILPPGEMSSAFGNLKI